MSKKSLTTNAIAHTDFDETPESQEFVKNEPDPDDGGKRILLIKKATCFLCQGKHSIKVCPNYTKYTDEQIFKVIKEHNLCPVCLSRLKENGCPIASKHKLCEIKQCSNPKEHHTMLHKYFTKKSKLTSNAITGDDSCETEEILNSDDEELINISHIDDEIVATLRHNMISCSSSFKPKISSWMQCPVDISTSPTFENWGGALSTTLEVMP